MCKWESSMVNGVGRKPTLSLLLLSTRCVMRPGKDTRSIVEAVEQISASSRKAPSGRISKRSGQWGHGYGAKAGMQPSRWCRWPKCSRPRWTSSGESAHHYCFCLSAHYVNYKSPALEHSMMISPKIHSDTRETRAIRSSRLILTLIIIYILGLALYRDSHYSFHSHI